jgi:EAL domain-containing protein (putative c-di-GMP-specific phosphodiesterase class I)
MASEADFSDLVVMDRAVEVTFRPTGDRLSFARFGTLLSPARPISPPNFGPHLSWEVEWLARNLAQQALLLVDGSSADDKRRADDRRHAEDRRRTDERRRDAARSPDAVGDVPRHVRLLQDLRLAVAHDELSLHYQPICEVRTRAVTGQEALLRWTHPIYGAIAPAEFIPLAEGSGEIAAIGRWVLDHALAEAATWEQPGRVAVNLSPAQFRQADLVDMVRADLIRHQLPGHRLELELTEGVLIDDTSRALSVLRALKQLGVTIALDDFGTGYSNLTYLRVLPIDRIKIDQSFVQDLGTSPQVDAIVRAIIGIGQALGLEVTAEGVETEAQLEFLRAHGCAQVQGFLLGQPSPGPLCQPAPPLGSGDRVRR